jgi:uncharacterized protein
VAALALVRALQRQLIYQPDTTAVPPAADVVPGARDIMLHTADGLDLGAWFVPATGPDTGMAVLVAAGNAGNREGSAGFAEELSRRGLAVLLLDYRGYGGNPGSPSEEGLAARHPPAGLVVSSSFTELADVGSHHFPWLPVRTLLRDRFPVTDHLADSEVPVTVVPAALSAQVADAAPALVERVVIAGADHNDPVMFGPRVADAVTRLARQVD